MIRQRHRGVVSLLAAAMAAGLAAPTTAPAPSATVTAAARQAGKTAIQSEIVSQAVRRIAYHSGYSMFGERREPIWVGYPRSPRYGLRPPMHARRWR